DLYAVQVERVFTRSAATDNNIVAKPRWRGDTRKRSDYTRYIAVASGSTFDFGGANAPQRKRRFLGLNKQVGSRNDDFLKLFGFFFQTKPYVYGAGIRYLDFKQDLGFKTHGGCLEVVQARINPGKLKCSVFICRHASGCTLYPNAGEGHRLVVYFINNSSFYNSRLGNCLGRSQNQEE